MGFCCRFRCDEIVRVLFGWGFFSFFLAFDAQDDIDAFLFSLQVEMSF